LAVAFGLMNRKVNRVKHYGDTSMRNVFSDLPRPCRERLEEIQETGWSCSFYLGVVNDSMVFGMTARKGEMQCIACSTKVETAVESLGRDVNETNQSFGIG
jgi:hypothetical protein